MQYLLSIPIALLAFLFESYPRFLNREFGVDIWTHLLYLKEFHKKKGIPGKIGNGFLVAGEYDYPPAFILILSRFPFRIAEQYEFLFSPFFDAIHVILIFCIAYLFSGNILIGLLTQILYTLTPIIILENSSATPRSLGYTLFTVLMISMLMFLDTANPVFLGLSLISGSVIFITHRFTTQGFLFFGILFSVLNNNLLFVYVFIASFLLAFFLSGGFYLRVLKGHIGNLRFWRDNIDYRFAHQIKGNIAPSKTRDFVFRVYTQFLKFPPFVLAITNPWTIPALYVMFFNFPTGFMYQQFLYWVGISYLLSLITLWLKPLRFLGEGQRYLELSAFPTAFLASTFLISHLGTTFSPILLSIYSILGVGAFITIVVIQRKAIVKERIRTLTPGMKKMFSYLSSLKKKQRLLCIPHQITTSTIYHTGCPVLVNANYASIEKISDIYPFMKKPVRGIMEQFALDAILLNTDYASISDLKIGKYTVVKKIENFVLLKLR